MTQPVNPPSESFDPSDDFDPVWYLRAYPDIRAAGVDPWVHYSQSGKREGRRGTAVHAIELEHLLWRGFEDFAEPELLKLLKSDDPVESATAAWVLGRWEADKENWPRVDQLMRDFLRSVEGRKVIRHPGPILLGIHANLKCGNLKNAQSVLRAGIGSFGHKADFDLCQMLIRKASGADDSEISELLSKVFLSEGLTGVVLDSHSQGVLFDRLTVADPAPVILNDPAQPLVSVIVPVFNGASVLKKALSGLVGQTWGALEILVVDDGSTDETLAVANAYAQKDDRIRVIALGTNQGAYAARNVGFAEASGAFVTVHDADDWSHPSKTELQAKALISNAIAKASVSHWVRMDQDLEMARWRIEDGWVYRNISSLMVRSELRDFLGYWDRVRVNADTEYYERILAAFGPGSILEVKPGLPLSFGRTEQGSLTRQSATHLRTQFKGLRLDYMNEAKAWHKRGLSDDTLFMSQFPARRPFSAPERMSVGDLPPPATSLDIIKASSKFDADWYRATYLDVFFSDLDPARHYLEIGAAAELDPGPFFSTSAYRYSCSLERDQNPLLHWEAHGRPKDAPALIKFQGDLPDSGAAAEARVLIFAHHAGPMLFGAERSLLDMLRHAIKQGKAPIVVLPALRDTDYFKELLKLSHAIEVVPMPWRHGLRKPHPDTVQVIQDLIRKYEVNDVLVNTLVLDAPLVAARNEDCTSTVFVRELPAFDATLCRNLGMSQERLHEELLQQADHFLVASKIVADWLDCPERTELRPNAVDEELFDLPFTPAEPLYVAMISSNIAKKGLKDFLLVAEHVKSAGHYVVFRFIGPPSQDLHNLQPFPSNVEFRNYSATPAAALKQADIVVSLSKFTESFGRTVSEAMAAGRPVICYDRGAPAERVETDVTGFVVEADDPLAVANAIIALDLDRALLAKMSDNARVKARHIQELSTRVKVAPDTV